MKAYLDRNEIRFSIIVPVYNTEKYLRKCLDSIVNQTFKNFEAIVIDDGSTDNSKEILKEYADKYDCFKIIYQENSGVSAARNRGLDEAKGDWIVFIDSDDFVDINLLYECSKCIFRTYADIYHFNTQIVDTKNNVLEKRIFTIENDVFRFDKELWWFKYVYYHVMQFRGGWEVWTRVFRKRIIDENKIRFHSMDEVYAEDLLFTLQYTLCAKSVYVICNTLYNYVKRENSFTSSENIDENEVLSQLYNLAKIAYKACKNQDLFYFRDNYYKLYFVLINYHLNHVLSEIPKDRVMKALDNLNKNRLHRRWIRQAGKDYNELKQYEGDIKWLKKRKF